MEGDEILTSNETIIGHLKPFVRSLLIAYHVII